LSRGYDSSGNEAEVTRTVIVEAAAPIAEVVPEGKVIYLTFDDGPSIYTRRLLDVLRRYGIQATFFVTGNDPEIMAEIVNCGHAIGIHSVSHNYGRIYASEEAFLQELYRSQQNIYDATGVMTTLLRFPGGSSNTVSRFNPGIMTTLTQSVEDRGFQYFDWNVDSNDAGGAQGSDTVFENGVTGVQWQRVSIVLQHDTQDFSVDAVERIICWGLENGYRFLPLEPNSPGCHHEVNN
jgi:peptidoglycan/xylan/chitin deacetylase (PgdA/CDA1 family)